MSSEGPRGSVWTLLELMYWLSGKGSEKALRTYSSRVEQMYRNDLEQLLKVVM